MKQFDLRISELKMSRLTTLILLAALAGCATTGATLRSGVGDRFLEHPPYYAGQAASVLAAAKVVRFPVEFQRGAAQSPSFDPASGAGSAVAALVAEMNAFLDSLGGGRIRAITGETAPNVYFGCERDATNDCVERGDSVLGRRGTTMRLALERPSTAWIARSAAMLDSAGATHALLITLEVAQYWPRQTGMTGSKSVELGTSYVVSLPWLTSLETPVSVLQVTGAVLDREGRGVRVGAEGILAQRTALPLSAVGAQRLISNEDVERARTLRRSDLPGQPLAWRTALCHLLGQLGGQTCA
jgi:hypothetical protein